MAMMPMTMMPSPPWASAMPMAARGRPIEPLQADGERRAEQGDAIGHFGERAEDQPGAQRHAEGRKPWPPDIEDKDEKPHRQ